MAYIINAWLECPHPYLKVLNSQSGCEIFSFRENEVKSMLENGEICVTDLLSTNQQVLEDVVKQLALYRCGKGMQTVL